MNYKALRQTIWQIFLMIFSIILIFCAAAFYPYLTVGIILIIGLCVIAHSFYELNIITSENDRIMRKITGIDNDR